MDNRHVFELSPDELEKAVQEVSEFFRAALAHVKEEHPSVIGDNQKTERLTQFFTVLEMANHLCMLGECNYTTTLYMFTALWHNAQESKKMREQGGFHGSLN